MNTREQIVALRSENPTITAAEMARIIGVKRQRVSQLLPKLGLATSFPKNPNKCMDCGKEIARTSKRCRSCFSKTGWLRKRCSTCSKIVQVSRSSYKYRTESGRYSGRIYCNRACFYARNKRKNNEK